MVSAVRRKLTFSNVISLVALFIVLGGSAFAAISKNSVGTKQLKAKAVHTGDIANGAVTTNKLKNDAATGAKVKESSLGTVPNATNATNANNANTVGGHQIGYARITRTGLTAAVDASQSTSGITVTVPFPGTVPETTCVKPPFVARSAVGNVDFVADPGSNELLELTPVTDSGHRCAIGEIEVNTQNANTNTGVNVGYYIYFSS
jgi:hypothetical protein